MTKRTFFHADLHVDKHKGTATIPRQALNFAGAFAVGDEQPAEGKAKTVPVTLRARSGDVVTHWFWGRCVHDLEGFKPASAKLPIDYCHDDREALGFSDKQEVVGSDLVLSGVLIPHKPQDRVDEIVTKANAGFEWQASITFDAETAVLEVVPDGYTAAVNGAEFQGPGVIFREWTLRGNAICPYGYDPNTSVQFSNSGDEVAIRCKELTMPKTVTKPKAPKAATKLTNKPGKPAAKTKAGKFGAPEDDEKLADENEELEGDEVDPEAATETEEECDCKGEEGCECDKEDEGDPNAEEAVEMEAETEEEKAQASAKLSLKKQLAKFTAAFGAARGAKWLAGGLTFGQAQAKFAAILSKQNADLQKKVGELTAQVAALGGEDEPVTFAPAPEEGKGKSAKANKFSTHLPTGAAKFAASLKLPK